MSGKVEIYGRDDCRFCVAAVALCQKHKLPFVYHKITDALLGAELEERLGDPPKTVPQIFIGAHKIGGFEDLKRALPVVQQILFGG
ncbi:glutaredoxin [Bradyrhizobium sp. 179]|uniref:glutaredoxin family protein n=1 Tax=Bradyrhizobium sp. 179 TaxID=2782648 RepID=UPI001FFB90BA|nr:glutaredoxin domain-containing protein [Bradyrhizobium sp. 179]MCK1543416.1 glutaredoxin [Bradyrhizobium sp. 179]